jgi:hypothetical protein
MAASELAPILEEICAHPISRPFLFPMVQSPYVDADYLDQIACPMDLTTIQSRIDSGDYTISEFELDVQLIYTNTTRYFGFGTEFSNSGAALLGIFYKVTAKFVRTNDSWRRAAARLQTKIGRLLDDRPIVTAQAPLCNIDLGRPIRPQLVSEAELRCFVQAAKQLRKKGDAERMTKIIEEGESKRIGPLQKAKMDLIGLRSATARKLIEYAKTTFQERGMQYPEPGQKRDSRAGSDQRDE